WRAGGHGGSGSPASPLSPAPLDPIGRGMRQKRGKRSLDRLVKTEVKKEETLVSSGVRLRRRGRPFACDPEGLSVNRAADAIAPVDHPVQHRLHRGDEPALLEEDED